MNEVMPITSEEVRDTIIIRNKKIPVVIRSLEQTRLRFFPENPRAYSVLRKDGKVPTQGEIQEHLASLDHVKVLVQDIKTNGGLIDPLIVRDVTYEVLEGNSRLAAYRILADKDPVKWGKVRCTILPQDIDESLIFALLGQYHIKGKKDWAPFEQAGFLYRRFKKQKIDLKTLSLEIGLSQKKVKHLVDTYETMLENGEHDTARWSYYDEYLKSSKNAKAREAFPNLDEKFVEKVRSGEIPRAVDVRDKMPVICSAKGKTLEKFASGRIQFEEAYEHAVSLGGDDHTYKKMASFRSWLARPEVLEEFAAATGQVENKLKFELDKLTKLLQIYQKKLGSKSKY